MRCIWHSQQQQHVTATTGIRVLIEDIWKDSCERWNKYFHALLLVGVFFFFDKSKFKSITIKLQSLCQFCSHTYTFYLISNSLHLLLSLTVPNRGSLNRRSVLMKQQTNIEASNIFIITIAHSSKTKFWAKKEKLDYQTIELISIESIY